MWNSRVSTTIPPRITEKSEQQGHCAFMLSKRPVLSDEAHSESEHHCINLEPENWHVRTHQLIFLVSTTWNWIFSAPLLFVPYHSLVLVWFHSVKKGQEKAVWGLCLLRKDNPWVLLCRTEGEGNSWSESLTPNLNSSEETNQCVRKRLSDEEYHRSILEAEGKGGSWPKRSDSKGIEIYCGSRLQGS